MELWSAERPAVYVLTLQLSDGEGPTSGAEACQVAFRHSAIVNGELRHNGRRIMIRGVNRHEHDPLAGKVCCLSKTMQEPHRAKHGRTEALE